MITASIQAYDEMKDMKMTHDIRVASQCGHTWSPFQVVLPGLLSRLRQTMQQPHRTVALWHEVSLMTKSLEVDCESGVHSWRCTKSSRNGQMRVDAG